MKWILLIILGLLMLFMGPMTLFLVGIFLGYVAFFQPSWVGKLTGKVSNLGTRY